MSNYYVENSISIVGQNGRYKSIYGYSLDGPLNTKEKNLLLQLSISPNKKNTCVAIISSSPGASVQCNGTSGKSTNSSMTTTTPC